MTRNDVDCGPFPDDSDQLPDGSVIDGVDLGRVHADAADYVVVGSGAAGGTVAWGLAEQGFSVIVLEEGPWVRTRDFRPEVGHAFRDLYRWGGMGVVDGKAALPLLQGMGVGGSSTISNATVSRLPEDVYDEWDRVYGIGGTLGASVVEPCFDRLERLLNAHPVDDAVIGGNGELLRDGMLRLGIVPRNVKRNARGCMGCARCSRGCPHGAKLSTALTFIPWTLRLGGRLYANTRVLRARVMAGKAVGVDARTAAGGKLTVMARRGVVLAASTIQTPNILRRSGVSSRALGRNLSMHPVIGIGVLYDRDVGMDAGVTQAVETWKYRRTGRFFLESSGLSRGQTAVRFPGIGGPLMQGLSDYRRVAAWQVRVRASAVGRVSSSFGDDVVRYTLAPEDLAIGKRGLRVLGEIAFATGAREVWLGVHGLPRVLRSVDDLRLLDAVPEDPRRFVYSVSQMFGASRMGNDPRASVVGLGFSTHEVGRLYVVDSSLFPTNLGVNPQHSIMAVGLVAARRIGGN